MPTTSRRATPSTLVTGTWFQCADSVQTTTGFARWHTVGPSPTPRTGTKQVRPLVDVAATSANGRPCTPAASTTWIPATANPRRSIRLVTEVHCSGVKTPHEGKGSKGADEPRLTSTKLPSD